MAYGYDPCNHEKDEEEKEVPTNRWMETLKVARMRLMSCRKQSPLKSIEGGLVLSSIHGKGHKAETILDKKEDKPQEEGPAKESESNSSSLMSEGCWSVESTESDNSDYSISTISEQEKGQEILNKWLEDEEASVESVRTKWARVLSPAQGFTRATDRLNVLPHPRGTRIAISCTHCTLINSYSTCYASLFLHR